MALNTIGMQSLFLHPVTTKSKIETKYDANIYFDTLLKLKNINLIHFIPNNDDNSKIILEICKKKLTRKKY